MPVPTTPHAPLPSAAPVAAAAPGVHVLTGPALAAGPRLQAVDAMRGTAMLLVFVSHFADTFFVAATETRLHLELQVLGYLATPSFMLLSGLMLGLLLERRREDFAPVRRALQRRGVFLLTLGHVLIALAKLPSQQSPWDALRQLEVTDTIGLALLLGPLLVPQLTARVRLALAASAYGVSQLLVFTWVPEGTLAQVTKDALLGIWGPRHVLLYGFPFVPWLALYLAGSTLGEWLARQLAAGRWELVSRGLQRLALGLGTLAVAGLSAYAVVRWEMGRGASGSLLAALRHEASPLSKMPPGPTYLALYCGLGLALLALLLKAERAGRLRHAVRWAAMLGRHSLLAFIAQFFVYYSLLPALRPASSAAWPLYLLASLGLLLGTVRLVDGRRARAA